MFSINLFAVKEEHGIIASPIKLKVSLPIVDEKSCNDAYRPYSLRLARSQLCAGGVRGQDACGGDSGGPLMVFIGKRATWVLSGIVSLGPEQCGTPDIPGIYTKVDSYIDWIVKNLRK